MELDYQFAKEQVVHIKRLGVVAGQLDSLLEQVEGREVTDSLKESIADLLLVSYQLMEPIVEVHPDLFPSQPEKN